MYIYIYIYEKEKQLREEILVRWREKVKKKEMFEHMCGLGLECLTVVLIKSRYLPLCH